MGMEIFIHPLGKSPLPQVSPGFTAQNGHFKTFSRPLLRVFFRGRKTCAPHSAETLPRRPGTHKRNFFLWMRTRARGPGPHRGQGLSWFGAAQLGTLFCPQVWELEKFLLGPRWPNLTLGWQLPYRKACKIKGMGKSRLRHHIKTQRSLGNSKIPHSIHRLRDFFIY
jgi:hypothetical protein